MISSLPVPDFFPSIHYTFNNYLAFDLNWTAVLSGLYLAYYYVLEPVAAVGIFNSCMKIIVNSSILYAALVHPADGAFGSERHGV